MSQVVVRKVKIAALKTRSIGPRVLLIDGQNTTDLSAALLAAEYAVYEVHSGREALRSVLLVRPDLILLHLGPSNVDGNEAIRHLRERRIAPIIVISVRHEESEKIRSLDSGAHDYLTEPVSVLELLARMRAALRSVNAAHDDVFTVDDLKVDLGRRQVFVDQSPVRFTYCASP